MEYFYLIILILYDDNLPIYKYNKLILKEYMNSNNEILTILLKYDNTIDEEIKYIKNENLLLIKGEEILSCESTFNKTMKAIKFCYSNYKFNYIIRTNISTFWVYDNLLNFLKIHNRRNYIYGWKVYHLNNVGEREYFISGSGIIMQYKLVPKLFNHSEFKYTMDDVEISQHFISHDIGIKDAQKHNPNYLVKFNYDTKENLDDALNNINKNNICFIVNNKIDREHFDKYILDTLLLKYYNKKINSIYNKLYNIPIYWINLARSEKRRIKFIDQLEKYELDNTHRVEGVDGINLNLDNYNTIENLTKFELGCTLSHIKAIKEAYKNNDKFAIIMEDDCNFDYVEYQKNTIEELIYIMEEQYEDWDLLQLVICNRQDHNIRLSKLTDYIRKKFRNSTVCYLINKKGMGKIIEFKNKIYTQADYYLYDEINSYYLTKPYFSYNYSFDCISTIHNLSGDGNIINMDRKFNREDGNKKFWDDYYFSQK